MGGGIVMSSRLSDLKEAVKIGYSDWGIEESITGMYRCKVYESDGFDEDADKPLEISNVCAKCLFMEDEPHNYGDVIEPTSYDADCDECMGDSIIYLILGN